MIFEVIIYVSKDNRPKYEDLLKEMPKTLEVYLNESSKTTKIDVEWYCIVDNYENSNEYYFQFSPKWDENKYVLSEDIDLWTESPYIGVFLVKDNEISTLSVTGKSAETEVYNFLRGTLGCNVATTCGIMANIQCESIFNPTNLFLDTNGLYSFGLCQWNGDRYTALQNYCGSSYTTVSGQMKYLQHELKTSEANAWSKMQGIANTSTGSYTAGYNWAKYFERCAEYYKGVAQYVQRGNLARDKYWPEYGESQFDLPTTKTISDGVYEIQAWVNGAYCVGVKNNSMDNGGLIELQERVNSVNQKWEIKYERDGYYTIRNVASGKYLDIGISGEKGIQANQWTGYSDAMQQRWYVVPVGDTYCFVSAYAKELCLDVNNNTMSTGTKIQTATYGQGASQRYCLMNEKATAESKNIRISCVDILGISKQVAAGKKIKLTASVSPKNAANKAVTWKSSNTKVATVT